MTRLILATIAALLVCLSVYSQQKRRLLGVQ